MTNPNCGMCGNLNVRGFCNLTACSFPSNKTETIQLKKPTNADRIRSMTDEELANKMYDWFSDDCLSCPVLKDDCPAWNIGDIRCYDALLEWLKQGASE